jgi:hypothetical protein
VRQHSQQYRELAAEQPQCDGLEEAERSDRVAKQFQLVKLELEAVLKLERWDEFDDLFEECWKCKEPRHLEALADLVLVMHSSLVKANADGKYQSRKPCYQCIEKYGC